MLQFQPPSMPPILLGCALRRHITPFTSQLIPPEASPQPCAALQAPPVLSRPLLHGPDPLGVQKVAARTLSWEEALGFSGIAHPAAGLGVPAAKTEKKVPIVSSKDGCSFLPSASRFPFTV